MSDIRIKIKEFSDEFLLDQYFNKQHDYTQEAIAILKEEIENRRLLETDDQSQDLNPSQDTPVNYTMDEFVPIEHGFSRTDIPLAAEILHDTQIPFTVHDTQSSGTFVLESEMTHTYILSVPESLLAKARENLEQIFNKSEGHYAIQYASIKERLKAFCFHEINLPWDELTEEVDVHFSTQESIDIIRLIKRLIVEADTIEQKSGNPLFYYDNLEECAGHIAEKERTTFPKADLLTILETLQVYCDIEDFPESLGHTAEVLLQFFIQ